MSTSEPTVTSAPVTDESDRTFKCIELHLPVARMDDELPPTITSFLIPFSMEYSAVRHSRAEYSFPSERNSSASLSIDHLIVRIGRSIFPWLSLDFAAVTDHAESMGLAAVSPMFRHLGKWRADAVNMAPKAGAAPGALAGVDG